MTTADIERGELPRSIVVRAQWRRLQLGPVAVEVKRDAGAQMAKRALWLAVGGAIGSACFTIGFAACNAIWGWP